MQCDKDKIWSYAQNHPELVVRDLSIELCLDEFGKDIVRKSLMKRGINKWLAVRRSLIRIKMRWKTHLVFLQQYLFDNKRDLSCAKLNYLRGYRDAMETCRSEVRLLCHSERWVEWSRHSSRFETAITKRSFEDGGPVWTRLKQKIDNK